MASGDSSKINRKLNYLDDTKSLIRQAMTNKGIDVTDNTTFRAYADLINNLILEKDQTDATVMPSDMVAGKIAYNNNNKVIGTLTEYSSLTSQALEVLENNDNIIGKIQTDSRTLLAKNAMITVSIPKTSIFDYNEAMAICNSILGDMEDIDALEAYGILNVVMDTPDDTYEGMGGSYEEIMEILNQIWAVT